MSRSKPTNQSKTSGEYFESNTVTIPDILLIAARQIKIIIITPSILCTLTIINVMFFAKPVFTSTSKIMSSSGGAKSQVLGIASQFGINIPTSQAEPIWVYKDIIKSRKIAKSVLKRNFDTQKFEKQTSLFEIITDEKPGKFSENSLIGSKAIKSFIKKVKISEDIKTGIYTLRTDAFEPQLAADINKALIEELDGHQRLYNKDKTSKTRQFIADRILSTEKELKTAEENLKIFRDRNRRIENSPALLLQQQRLDREVAVLTGVFTTLKQQLETTKIEEVRESDYVIVIDLPEVPIERTYPKKKSSVILAGIIGLGLGFILGYLRETFEKTSSAEKKKIKKAGSILWKNMAGLITLKRNKAK